MATLALLATLTLGQWPAEAQVSNQPRNLAVLVEVIPHQAIFKAEEPLLCDVLIRNQLQRDIRVSRYADEPNAWNGETAFVRVVDIYRQPNPVSRPGEWRPKVSLPAWVSGRSSHPVKPGDTHRFTIDLKKWPLVNGWVPGEYRFNIAAESISLDDYSSATIVSDFASFGIQ